MIAEKALCLLAWVVVATASEHGCTIDGVTAARPDQFVHRMSIRHIRDQHIHIASGSILSNTWVLCPAHSVFEQVSGPRNLTVYAGGQYLTDGARSDVLNIVVHPLFNPRQYNNNIALLKVTRIRWHTNRVAPIKLPTHGLRDDARDWGVANGWGPLVKGSQIFQVVSLNVQTIPASECRNRYRVLQRETQVFDTNVCVQNVGRGISSVNSAGNALTLRNQTNILVGILSIGLGGELEPELYTRVWPYIPFIRRITGIRN